MNKVIKPAVTATILVFWLVSLSTQTSLAQPRNQAGEGKAKPAAGTRSNSNAGTRNKQAATDRVNGSNNGNNANNNFNRTKTTDRSGNNINSGNKNVNVDNSTKNVNINVDNSKNISAGNNTVVRRNVYTPYTRPPYRYGGHAYYSHHPYHYHPYQPYHWGPLWHPWGFVVATLATTAVIVSIHNQQYHYDQGVYYVAASGGYTVVPAPVGATITTLPPNTQTVVVNQTTNNYYYGGTYYEKTDKGYTVVPPTAGTIVEKLPEGGKEVTIGSQKYVQFGETYYQPVKKDGKDVYEVVEVEADKK
jgi:hypothetical protein